MKRKITLKKNRRNPTSGENPKIYLIKTTNQKTYEKKITLYFKDR